MLPISESEPAADVRVIEILALVEELENQVKHLVRSQQELKEALLEVPGDIDFISAIEENISVIGRKKLLIDELNDELLMVDQRVAKMNLADRLPVSTSSLPEESVFRVHESVLSSTISEDGSRLEEELNESSGQLPPSPPSSHDSSSGLYL